MIDEVDRACGVRMAGVSTLPSSKVNALTMWRCSGSVIERKNRRAWL